MKRLFSWTILVFGPTVFFSLGTNTARASDPNPTAPRIVVTTAEPQVVIPACDAPCLKKVCVPGTDVKVTTTRVYGEVCEDFCMPKCSLPKLSLGFLHKHDDCDACPTGCPEEGTCANCEHRIYTKKFLVVKVKKCEEIVNKCHVELQPEEPSCRTHLFGHKAAEPAAACLPETVIIQSPAPALSNPAVKMPQATDSNT